MPRTRPDLLKPCGGKAKGFTVTGMLEQIAAKYGPPTVAELAATLPAEFREPIEKNLLLPSSWVPMELYFTVVQFLVDRFHGGDPKAALEIGRSAAAANIGAFFKVVLSFTSPAMVISLSGRFWKSYYDVGELKVTSTEKGRVIGELSGWPYDDEITVNELGGSFLAYLENSRGKDVKLIDAGPSTPGTLRFDIHYR